MQLQLLWQNSTQQQAYPIIDGRPVIIGRKKDCDIVLSNRTVSRQHAELLVKDGRIQLHNLSQTCPIHILTPLKLTRNQTILLKSGQWFSVGVTLIQVSMLRQLNGRQVLRLATPHQNYAVDDQAAVVIGRQPDCQIVLDDQQVSARHAEITFRNGGFQLRNLSQTTDTYVYVKQILRQGETAPLEADDAFELGLTHFKARSLLSSATPQSAKVARLKIRCPGCRRRVGITLKDCPWCGLMLAGGASLT